MANHDSDIESQFLNFRKQNTSVIDQWVYKDQIEHLEDASVPESLRQKESYSLSRVNRVSGYHWFLLKEFSKSFKKYFPSQHEPLRMLDIGCGNGDILELFHDWFKRNDIHVELWGCDSDKTTISNAVQHFNTKGLPIRFIESDGRSLPFESKSFDIIFNNRMIHHIRSAAGVVQLFSEISRVGKFCWINDLDRRFYSPFLIGVLAANSLIFDQGYHLWIDSIRSARRAYRRDEINFLLDYLRKQSQLFHGLRAEPYPFFPYWFIEGKL